MSLRMKRLLIPAVLIWGMLGAACDNDDARRPGSDSKDDSDKDGDADGGSGADGDTDTDTDTDTDSDSDSDVVGDCDPFPSTYAEQAAIVGQATSGSVVQFNAFKGMGHDHASAEAIFELTLWEGYGATLAPGTITLSGDESGFATCAYCLLLHQDVTLVNNQFSNAAHSFMPTSGTLEITELNPAVGGKFSFTINATLSEVIYDPANTQSTPVEDGCQLTIKDFTRTAVLTQGK